MTGQRRSDEPPRPLEELEAVGGDDLFLSRIHDRRPAGRPIAEPDDGIDDLPWGLGPGAPVRAPREGVHRPRPQDWESPELDD
jgi:hypothetical protein